MKTKQVLFFLFLNLFITNSNAQEFEKGNVSLAELQEKHHPKDTAAVAAILFEIGKVDFEYSQENGFTMITDVTTRIKIYKKAGYDWANKKISYNTYSNPKEVVYFTDAVTYNLVNGKIEKTKLKSDGTFEEKINKYWSTKKLAMPNIKEGSVIEYTYRVKSPRLSELSEWTFQTSIPVNYSEFKTYVPEYFVYNANLKGYLMPVKTVESTNKSLGYTYRDTQGSRGTENPKSSLEKLEFIEKRTTYVAKDIPALKEEAFVNNIANYTASVSHELSSIHYPNTPYKNLSTNWESVAKVIYDDQDFGAELNKTGYFEEELKTVTTGLTTNDEKINAIFNHVKNTITWNDFYGYSCNDGVKSAFKNKTGNIAEINLMLTAMLRFAGLEANPVLVSTRSNGIALFPSRTAFNYVIVAVETPEGKVLLDATSKNALPNILPIRDLNWFGRLIRKDGTSSEIDLMPKNFSNDVVFLTCNLESSGKVTGKFQRQLTNYNAMLFRNLVNGENQDTYLEKFENEHGKIEVEEYKRNNEKELQLPVTEVFSFAANNFGEVIQDKIYVNPLLFFTSNENPFKQETREFPIDYSYPFIDKYAINIQIPEGYSVEILPASMNIGMQDDLGSFKFLTNVSGNTIQISAQLQISESIIGVDYYSMIKEFYKKMIDKQNEKIVLKKV